MSDTPTPSCAVPTPANTVPPLMPRRISDTLRVVDSPSRVMKMSSPFSSANEPLDVDEALDVDGHRAGDQQQLRVERRDGGGQRRSGHLRPVECGRRRRPARALVDLQQERVRGEREGAAEAGERGAGDRGVDGGPAARVGRAARLRGCGRLQARDRDRGAVDREADAVDADEQALLHAVGGVVVVGEDRQRDRRQAGVDEIHLGCGQVDVDLGLAEVDRRGADDEAEEVEVGACRRVSAGCRRA